MQDRGLYVHLYILIKMLKTQLDQEENEGSLTSYRFSGENCGTSENLVSCGPCLRTLL